MLNLLHNPYVYPALVVVVMLVACVHVYRHDSPALLLDGLLVVAALVSQSVPAVLAALVVYAARWHWRPTTAAERQLAARADWLLPGAARRQARPASTGTTERLPAIVQPSGAPQTSARPMAPAEWLAALNDDPTAPHLGIVGPPRLGKTTLALAVIGRRPGQVVIATPKAAKDEDAWGGADCARPTIDLAAQQTDWTPIAQAIGNVHFEMLRRNVENDLAAPPITLILDEYSTTVPNITPIARRQVVELWAMAPSCGIRVIVISQDVNARAWGLDGRRDILGSLVFAQVAPGRLWGLGRLDPNGRLVDPRPLDTRPLVALASSALLAGREWGGAGASVSPPPPAPQGAPDQTDRQTDADTLRKLRAAGLTRDQARAAGFKFDNGEWAEAGELLAKLLAK